MVLSQKIHGAFKGAVERITGPRTVSAFKEKGVLSVSEFVLAGDNLVSKCPTWSWLVPISIPTGCFLNIRYVEAVEFDQFLGL